MPLSTMIFKLFRALLVVPVAVGVGVSREEDVEERLGASTLMVKVGGEDGWGVGVADPEMVPMDRVAVVDGDSTDEKDGEAAAVEEREAVGLTFVEALCLPDRLPDSTVIVGEPEIRAVLDPDCEPAPLVGVERRLSDASPLPVAPNIEGVDKEESDGKGEDEYEAVAEPVEEDWGENDEKGENEWIAAWVELDIGLKVGLLDSVNVAMSLEMAEGELLGVQVFKEERISMAEAALNGEPDKESVTRGVEVCVADGECDGVALPPRPSVLVCETDEQDDLEGGLDTLLIKDSVKRAVVMEEEELLCDIKYEAVG